MESFFALHVGLAILDEHSVAISKHRTNPVTLSSLSSVSADVGHREHGREAGDVWLLEARVRRPAAHCPLHV